MGRSIAPRLGVASCTGVLIAPNLLLTARHCVSSTQPALICGESPLSEPVAGGNILSTGDVTVEATSIAVRGLRAEVPAEGDDECGFDIAAVILQAELPGASIYPPRVDEPVTTGETFTAVGYETDGRSGIGTRRFQEDVSVACVGGEDCTISVVQDTEWVATDDAFCRSDSGAPAIDASGQVIGIVSKGINPCSTPVLSSIYAWREWIQSVGQMAAAEGGYPTPVWAGGESADAGVDASVSGDAGIDGSLDEDAGPGEDAGGALDASAGDALSADAAPPTSGGDAGCSVARTLSSTPRSFPVLLLMVSLLLRRRRSQRKRVTVSFES